MSCYFEWAKCIECGNKWFLRHEPVGGLKKYKCPDCRKAKIKMAKGKGGRP